MNMVPVEDMVTAQTRASTLIKAISTAAMAAVVIISFAVYHASMPKLAVFVTGGMVTVTLVVAGMGLPVCPVRLNVKV